MSHTEFYASLPVRGAWVEISGVLTLMECSAVSLPVRGAWVEISRNPRDNQVGVRRSPCGERGLKSLERSR